MVYEVPKSKASLKQNQFEFKIPGSQKIHRIPLLQYLTNGLRDPMMKVLQDAAQYLDAEGKPTGEMPRELHVAAEAATRRIFDHHAPGALDNLDTEQTRSLMEAWQNDSNTSLGKSSSSSGSSKGRTAKQ